MVRGGGGQEVVVGSLSRLVVWVLGVAIEIKLKVRIKNGVDFFVCSTSNISKIVNIKCPTTNIFDTIYKRTCCLISLIFMLMAYDVLLTV